MAPIISKLIPAKNPGRTGTCVFLLPSCGGISDPLPRDCLGAGVVGAEGDDVGVESLA